MIDHLIPFNNEDKAKAEPRSSAFGSSQRKIGFSETRDAVQRDFEAAVVRARLNQ